MSIDRIYIDKVADVVRSSLDLEIPISLSDLCRAIHRIKGKCMPISNEELDADAIISTPDCQNNTTRFTIQYQTNKPDTRIAFSIAHELGHLFLHMLDSNNQVIPGMQRRRDLRSSKDELEANEFAAAFLMPEDEFIDCCYNHLIDDKNINITEVARNFNVSVQAARVRGIVLGLWKN